MRTTVQLPDPLFREAKATAARHSESLKSLFQRAVMNELNRPGRGARPKRVAFPLLDSAQPGSLDLSNEDIDRLLA